MWILLSELSELQLAYLCALGRATAVAQNFESNCKFVFHAYDFALGGEQLTWDKFAAHGRKLVERSLARAIKGGDRKRFSEHQVSTLEAARIARNYFAHQAAIPALYVPPKFGRQPIVAVLKNTVDPQLVQKERTEMLASHFSKTLGEFGQALADLAKGDSLICRWSYEIQEKGASLPLLAKTYAAETVEWVLRPLVEVGLVRE